MKRSPRLRLEPRPSRIGCVATGTACATTAILLAVLPLPVAGYAAGAATVLGVLVSGLWRCTGRGVPAIVHVGLDRRITVTDRDGRSLSGAILDDSYVGAWLTTIVWAPDGARWWLPARSVLVLPDMLPADDFRRLRVALRYGRPAAATSGADAG